MTTLNQAVRTLNQREATQAALRNEQLTRERVRKLEHQIVDAEKRAESVRVELYQVIRRGFWGRITWLLRGK